MCGPKSIVLWDPKKMEVGKEYKRSVSSQQFVAIKQADGSVDVYRDEPAPVKELANA